jgi:hypothetical protein
MARFDKRRGMAAAAILSVALLPPTYTLYDDVAAS